MVPRLSSRPTSTMERQGVGRMINREPRRPSRIPWTSKMKRATLHSSTRPSTSKRYAGTTAVKCGVGHLTSGTWCSASSRASRTATSSLRHRRDRMSSWRCYDQAPISSRPSTTKSSSMPRISNSYVAFILNLCMLSLISFTINSSIFSDN